MLLALLVTAFAQDPAPSPAPEAAPPVEEPPPRPKRALPVTGGFGAGVLAGIKTYTRPGVLTSASIELRRFTEDLPWLGLGAEAAIGFEPRYCTTCTTKTVARLGIGPTFRKGIGFIMPGVRASVQGPRQSIRPFIMTKASLPVEGLVFRPYAWIEGITATEIGLGLELGFHFDNGTFRMYKSKAGPKMAPTGSLSPTG